MEKTVRRENPLGVEPVGKLMMRFAVPSIIAMLVGAIYNIVDQLFIGHAVGALGNAATNIAFPLTNLCTACALLFGIGGASCFNLAMGRKQYKDAPYFIGNALCCIIGFGTLLCLITQIFLKPMLVFFGSPADVLPYAMTYVRITSIGFPFLILTTGGGHLMRADGSPKMTMICNLSGAIINTILDALFVLVFHWGMAGAAYATIIGQIFSGCLVIRYMMHFKTVPLTREHVRINPFYMLETMKIGMASGVNQVALMSLQIVLNNSLKFYGAKSVYGEAIPIACAGIVTKVAGLFFSIVIGFAQGSQPIMSFNYGAKNYKRVKLAYIYALRSAFLVSLTGFICFQLFPRTIIGFFGEGDELYYQFAVSYFRIFLFFTWANCLQPLTATFFTSIGKAKKGLFLSLTRQILFLIPLILILPMIFGIDGILFAGPISDGMAAVAATIMAYLEFKNMQMLEEKRL